ncbi:MAG: OprD family outer membrane porin [Methylococcales bacterium]|nr:OprD family outer membrane porin [Methylococcales bacterium]
MALLFAVTPVHAHLHGNEEQEKPFNFKSPSNTAPFQAVEHDEEYYGCSGYIRSGYIQTNDSYASAFAGELGCGYQLNQYIKAHLGVFASIDSGLNSQNDDKIQTDFFNKQKDSYFILGEAVLTISYQQLEAHLGRQNFDSPHMDADDLRMIANLFEAYLLDYHFSDALYFGTGFVREASGWENGADASQFISVGEALGGESSGAWLSWLNYQQDHYSSDTWFYFIPDHLLIFYAEFIYNNKLMDRLSYSLGLQYDLGKAIGTEKLSDIDAHTLGVMATLSWADLTFTMAYNKNFGNTTALASIGGGAFFTSLEDQTLDAVSGDKAESLLLNLEYKLDDYLTFGAAMGKFTASNKTDYNKQEINLFINYSWKQKLTAELMYAIIDDKNSEPDIHQIRAILTYRY